MAQAETHYRRAMALDPGHVPAWIGLAQELESGGHRAEALALLEQGASANRQSAELAHALGLVRVRQGQGKAVLEPLARAVALRPEHSRYAYVHAVALHDLVGPVPALATLKTALKHHPHDVGLLDLRSRYASILR